MKLSALATHRRLRPLLGTFVEVTLECDEAAGPIGFEAGFGAIADVQALMSFHDPRSGISRLGSTRVGEWVELDPLTIAVLSAAAELEESSEGIFNIAKSPRRAIEVRRSRARRLHEVKPDLGGIAKGFAVDLAVQAILKAIPSASGVVNAGGDLKTFGGKERQIQLRSETARGPVLRTVSCADVAVATSCARAGESFSAAHWREGARFFSDQTVSVFARDCIWADALTKIALMADGATTERCLRRFGGELLRFDPEGRPIEAA